MTVVELFHKRQQKLRGEVPDVYSYDPLPLPLKVQIVYVWDEVLGTASQASDHSEGPHRLFSAMVQIFRKELGVLQLPGANWDRDAHAEWRQTFLGDLGTELALSMVELAGRAMLGVPLQYEYLRRNNTSSISSAGIEEINERFREHGIEYQFTDREIVRIDSEFIHTEAVKPALVLLRQKNFQGAQQEFLKAHEHYRHGDTKGALTEALKAFESVMQAICDKRGWPYDPKATSKTLIEIMFAKGLVPAYWQSHFGGLRANLEGGVPTARNREGGHGQGVAITTVPSHLAAYVLHQTAAAIVFLAESEAAV